MATEDGSASDGTGADGDASDGTDADASKSGGPTDGPADSTDDERDERVVRPADPPLPEVAFRVVNPLVGLLLRSPLHGLVSDAILLLTFTGRRTGNEYTTPVSYRQEGDTLSVTTHSPWWRNLRGGAPVTVRLRGERRRGTAVARTDPEAVARHVHAFLEDEGVERANRIGLEVTADEVPTVEELAADVEETVLVEITLDGD